MGERGMTGHARGTARLDWVDATRGYSVAAVVLFHVILWSYAPAIADLDGVEVPFWGTVNSILGSVRMPVLLAVSGLVMARRIRTGPLVHGTLAKAAANYYLYVVWLLVYAAFYAVVTQAYLPHRVDGPVEVLAQLVVPATTLWYLLALAVYTVLLTLVRRVPAWVVLTAATVLSTLVHGQSFPDQLWNKVPELFVFFAFGVYGATALRRLAERARVAWLVAAAVVAVGVTGLGRFTQGRAADALVFVPRGLAFMVLMVLAVVLAVRWAPVRRLGVALGRQTLAVYVLHPLWIALLTVLVVGPLRPALRALLANPAGAALYPLLVTALLIALSLPVRALAGRVRLGWLFALPTAWSDALSGARRPTSSRETASEASPTGTMQAPYAARLNGPVAASGGELP